MKINDELNQIAVDLSDLAVDLAEEEGLEGDPLQHLSFDLTETLPEIWNERQGE